MSTRNENKLVGLVSRAVALAVALVVTGVAAAGFASATNHLPATIAAFSLASVHN